MSDEATVTVPMVAYLKVPAPVDAQGNPLETNYHVDIEPTMITPGEHGQQKARLRQELERRVAMYESALSARGDADMPEKVAGASEFARFIMNPQALAEDAGVDLAAGASMGTTMDTTIEPPLGRRTAEDGEIVRRSIPEVTVVSVTPASVAPAPFAGHAFEPPMPAEPPVPLPAEDKRWHRSPQRARTVWVETSGALQTPTRGQIRWSKPR